MDLETQQEQLEEANKLNNILISIEKQNSLLDELYKNNQKPKPTNTITLEKPNLEMVKNDTEKKNIEKSNDKETNLELKEEISSTETNEKDSEDIEEEKININRLDNNQKENLNVDKIPSEKIVEKEKVENKERSPDWFNVVREQIKELISNNDLTEQSKENIKEIDNIKESEEIADVDSNIEEKSVNTDEKVLEEKEVNNFKYEQPLRTDIELNQNTSYITKKIEEKSNDNLQKIENLKEETISEQPILSEENNLVDTEKEESPQINITLKNNNKLKEELPEIEKSEPIEELPVTDSNAPIQAEAPLVDLEDNTTSKEELQANSNIEDNTVVTEEQENTKIPNIEQPEQSQASFTSEEAAEPQLESNNSLESLVSEISKQLSQLSQNNDKNVLNIANILIGINNTLRSMSNNLDNIGNNNVFVNGENNSMGKKRSTDNFNESNLQRYRQQIRNSDMINDVATRVLRHSIPGVTL